MALTTIPVELLTLDDGVTITVDDNSDNLTLVSTDADASTGPNLRMYRNSSSPADSDELGNIFFQGRNDNSQDVVYATIETFALDVSDGTEDAVLNFNVMSGGSSVSFFKGNNTEVVVNDDSNDLDFRVESDGNANMLVVDASTDNVGIGIAPSNTFSVGASGTVTTRYTSTDTSAFSLLMFGNDGSIVFSADHGNAVADSAIVFKTDGAQERVRFDPSGNVGIKTSAMTSFYAKDLVVNGAAEGGITIAAPSTSANSYLMFADGTSGGSEQYAGYVGYLHNTDHLRIKSNGNITFYGITAGADVLISDPSGHITMPLQPAFSAKTDGAQNDIATSSYVNVEFDTEIYDKNSDFNTSTYTFTAPVTGTYAFDVSVRFDALDSAANYYAVFVETSNRTYYNIHQVTSSDAGYRSLGVSAMADMDANDTAYVRVYQDGGTQQTDLGGSNGGDWFQGILLA